MKGMNGWLAATAAAAFLLGFRLAGALDRQTDELSRLQAALETSTTAWQTTASAKEALQDELTQVSHALREAELTIQENAPRLTDLNSEILQLSDDLAHRTAEKEALTARNAAMAEANLVLSAYLQP